MPLDPSEPMFPVRPNEPVCQYYMKHGTCKFGQTCKFHHPPQSQLPEAVLAARKNDAPQLLWNSSGGPMNAQLLPQRPDEPNCIFFLKNGRCKYGATCRYHHPLNYHDRRAGDDGRRPQPQMAGDKGRKIHYVTQLPPGTYQHGHFIVADGTVAFLSMDGAAPAQLIPVSQGNGEQVFHSPSGSRPLSHSRDVAASTSTPSIASSYETAMSNMDMMGSHGESSSLWNRPRRNNSSNSLGAYNTMDGSGRHHVVHGGRTVFIQDSNMPRVASTSSNATSEGGSVYYEAAPAMGRSGSSQQVQGAPGSTWRGRRSNSFDYSGPGNPVYYEEEYPERPYRSQQEGQRSPGPRRPPPSSARRRAPQGGEVDDGLSMMTSALLTMLDTPEEGHYEGYYDEQSVHSSQMSTPQMRPVDFPLKDEDSPETPSSSRLYHSNSYPPGYYDHSNAADDQFVGVMMPNDRQNRMEPSYDSYDRQEKYSRVDSSFPRWQGAPNGRSLQENAQSLSVSRANPDSPHNPSNVGLYLP